MKILFLNKLNERWQQKLDMLAREFPSHNFTVLLKSNERLNELKTTDAVISGRLTEDEIKQAENLKVIFVPFTGLNKFPSQIIKQKGIVVSNTHANARFVAERAVTLALSLLGKVNTFHNNLKEGNWSYSENDEGRWETIQNKKIGIIGLGHIGIHIAKFLNAFNCEFYGFNKSRINPNEELISETSNNIRHIIDKSDVIFVALPLNSETKNIINSEILAKMSKKYIINIGRAETISEDGLYNALKDGILKGAALDVWYKYPQNYKEQAFPSNYPYGELPNVLLSPHKSSQTTESVNAMIEDTYENIRSFLINGKPKNIANL